MFRDEKISQIIYPGVARIINVHFFDTLYCVGKYGGSTNFVIVLTIISFDYLSKV